MINICKVSSLFRSDSYRFIYHAVEVSIKIRVYSLLKIKKIGKSTIWAYYDNTL